MSCKVKVLQHGLVYAWMDGNVGESVGDVNGVFECWRGDDVGVETGALCASSIPDSIVSPSKENRSESGIDE